MNGVERASQVYNEVIRGRVVVIERPEAHTSFVNVLATNN